MLLITGATGFLGSELAVQLLKKGIPLRCFKRPGSVIPTRLQNSSIDWAEAELNDPFALEQAFTDVTTVIHCAALVSFKTNDRQRLHRVNAEGTANLVNLCLQYTTRLIHVSSVAAVGEAKPGELIHEGNHWEFNDLQSGYAISKYEGEMEVWRGIAEGLNAVIVNPSVIIGKNAGDKGSGTLFNAVKKGMRYFTTGTVGLVDVEDVAAAVVLLLESDIHNERFILNAESVGFRELFSKIAGGYGLPAPGIPLNTFIMGFAWRAANLLSKFTGREYSLTRETAASAFKRHDYSTEKFQKAFPGFTFKPIDTSISEICGNNPAGAFS